jgi:hypothetical protein
LGAGSDQESRGPQKPGSFCGMRLTVQNGIFICADRLFSDLGNFEDDDRNTDTVATLLGLVLFAILVGRCNIDVVFAHGLRMRVMRIASGVVGLGSTNDTNRLGLMSVMHAGRCVSGRRW